jgi:hypothetical protein
VIGTLLRRLILILSLLAVAVALGACQSIRVDFEAPGTVLEKQFNQTKIATLKDRTIIAANVMQYPVAINVTLPESGETRIYLCYCDKATWDDLVEGAEYIFGIVEGTIVSMELTR